MTVTWDDDVDAILTGDTAAGFAYVTPARGVVVVPMAPIGIRDRDAGTLTLTTSIGLPKKVVRLRANPHVAVSYHAREFSDTTLPFHVLVQGTATVADHPDRVWLESVTPEWEHFLGPRESGLLGRLNDVYYWQRLAITVQVRRVLVFDGTGAPVRVHGEPLPTADVVPQKVPAQGTGPRVDAAKAVKLSQPLPHTVLGWVGADALPVVSRAQLGTAGERGIDVTATDIALPQGGRRAGLTAHRFGARMLGQEQRVYTGWLEVGEDAAVYAPHTSTGYAMPPSKLLMSVGTGLLMRANVREARKLGVA